MRCVRCRTRIESFGEAAEQDWTLIFTIWTKNMN